MSNILGGKDPISLFLLQVIHCGALVFNRLPLVIFLGSHQPFEVDSTGMQGCQNTFAYIFTRRYLSSKTYTLYLFILSFASAFVKPVTSFQPTSLVDVAGIEPALSVTEDIQYSFNCSNRS